MSDETIITSFFHSYNYIRPGTELYEVDEVNEFVDPEPEFPGGMVEFQRFVSKHIEYLILADTSIPSSMRVYVNFIVGEDVSITDV